MMRFLAASALAFTLIGSSAATAGLHLGGGHNRHPDSGKPCYRHHHHHHHCKVDEFGHEIGGANTAHF